MFAKMKIEVSGKKLLPWPPTPIQKPTSLPKINEEEVRFSRFGVGARILSIGDREQANSSGETLIDYLKRHGSGGVPNFGNYSALQNQEDLDMIDSDVELEYPDLPSKEAYGMQKFNRRAMQEIIPGLFLGPHIVAGKSKLAEMKAAGLTHVVVVRDEKERDFIQPNHAGHFNYLVVEITDSPMENIILHFKVVHAFLDECINFGGKALVHGNYGTSRSATLVVSYIMSKFGVTDKEALEYVQSKGVCCCPNEGFMAQLREYEPIYKAEHTVRLPLPGQEGRISMKRGFHDELDESGEQMDSME